MACSHSKLKKFIADRVTSNETCKISGITHTKTVS